MLHGLEFIFVPGVYALITFLAVTCQIFVIIPFLKESGLSIAEHLLPLNVLIAGIYYTYTRLIFSDPGKFNDAKVRLKNEEKGPKWCVKCQQVKPPRAHHCKNCDACILRMDHHCPWIGNCVGWKNHLLFLKFLTYVNLTLCWIASFICRQLYYLYQIRNLSFHPGMNGVPTESEIIWLLIDAFVLFLTWFPIFLLSCYQWYNIFFNMTTIEHLCLGSRSSSANPYDVGVLKNAKLTLGALWYIFIWIPIGSGWGRGNGTDWVVEDWFDPSSEVWPPKLSRSLPTKKSADKTDRPENDGGDDDYIFDLDDDDDEHISSDTDSLLETLEGYGVEI